MAHSPVYYDEVLYVTQVAHVSGVNDLVDQEDYGYISGLLEYSLCPGDGMLRVYDPDDDELYKVHTVEDWEGLDKGAVQALLEAIDGTGDALETGEDFRRARNVYMRTGDPVEALTTYNDRIKPIYEQELHVHPVGTVVRMDYGEDDLSEPDVFVKRDNGRWEMSGTASTFSDADIAEEDYEVIYYV